MAPFSSKPIQLSIVIPAFNEADNIAPVIQDTMATLSASPLANRYELLLVNDGSSDGSDRVCDEIAKRHACVRVFHHPANRGLGEAIKTGFRNSSGEFLTFIPSDGEVKVDQALRLYEQLDDADIITSTRLGYLEGGAIRTRSFYRGFLSWGFKHCVHAILGFSPGKLTGIYLVRGDIVRSLPMHSQTALVSLEIYLHCLHSGVKMRHGEITIHPRLSGESKIANMSGAWKQLWEMIKLRRKIRQHIHQTKAATTPLKRAA